MSDGSRRVTGISEVIGLDDDGEVELRPIFEFRRRGTSPSGGVEGEFLATGYLPTFLGELIVRGLIQKGEAYL
jgi:pilus assembly protein CpaF